MKIIEHRLDLYAEPRKWSVSEDKFLIKEWEVVAENATYIVLNDLTFTKLQKPIKDKYPCNPVLGKEYIKFKNCLDEKGVFFSLYSESRMSGERIKKKILEKATKEYGYLFSGELDLTILETKETKND